MQIQHYQQEPLQREITAIVGQYLDLQSYRLFFFGSRVIGLADDSSDIDVGIQGAQPVARRVMRSIKEALEELPTLYSIDVVDFCSVTAEFREVALQHVEPFSVAGA